MRRLLVKGVRDTTTEIVGRFDPRYAAPPNTEVCGASLVKGARDAQIHIWTGALVACRCGCGGVLAGGAALAAIPDSSGVIHGCYQKNVGNLRVIDPSAGDSCRPPEIALNWSQTGPKGRQGRRGRRATPAQLGLRAPPVLPARRVIPESSASRIRRARLARL
jgi:hypothetical protein